MGARGSPLSVAQTSQVRHALAGAWGLADRTDEVLPFQAIMTTGDMIRDRPLSEAGGKGLFTRELDDALLDGRIDLAVHSMKDLPTHLPDGLALVAVPARADPRDVFLSTRAGSLSDLPQGAILGTASLRRQAQALFLRPDLRPVMLRGNVDTRLRRLAEGAVHATFLARAGLMRLGRDAPEGAYCVPVDPDEMLPAVGQGALAITARADDARARAALAAIACTGSALAVAAERGVLEALDGSCRTPIAAHARVRPDGTIELVAEALAPDGTQRWRRQVRGGAHHLSAAHALGLETGTAIRRDGGAALEAVIGAG